MYVSSFETTQNQLLGYVEDITGKSWSKEDVTSAEKVKQAKDTIAAGAEGMQWMMAQGTLAAAALFGGDTYQSDFMRYGKSSNQLLGLKSRDSRESVRAFVQP